MLRIAFKEWAVVCRALAEGRQALIIRKGGIAESEGTFRPEHVRFWLYPTYVHQQHDGIKADARPLLEAAEAERPPAGTIRLRHVAQAVGAYYVRYLDDALALNHLHIWSEDTIRKRFAYREPGLYVSPVRIFRTPTSIEIPDMPEFAGCKTWVPLPHQLSDDDAVPVLDDRTFATIQEEIERILNPVLLA